MTIISSGAIFLKELQKIVYKYVTESSQKIQTLTDDYRSFSDLKQLRFSGKNVIRYKCYITIIQLLMQQDILQ